MSLRVNNSRAQERIAFKFLIRDGRSFRELDAVKCPILLFIDVGIPWTIYSDCKI